MPRWIEYWENYANSHEDNFTENLGLDDLVVKSRFGFDSGRFKLSGKVKFNTDGNRVLSTGADYSLTHNISKTSNYKISHKSNGTFSLDGNFRLHTRDNFFVSLYALSTLEQSATKRNLPTKLHFRFHVDDDKIFAIGVEDWDVNGLKQPDVISANGVFGRELNNGYRFVGGAYGAFQVSTRSFLYNRYLLGLRQRNFSSYLEAGITRSSKSVVNPDTKAVSSEITHLKHINVLLDGTVNDRLKFSTDLKVGLDSGCLDTRIGAEYRIDDATIVKGRLQNDNSAIVSLTHNYRGLINFGIATKLTLDCPQTKEGSETKLLRNVRSKFGVFVELNETLI